MTGIVLRGDTYTILTYTTSAGTRIETLSNTSTYTGTYGTDCWHFYQVRLDSGMQDKTNSISGSPEVSIPTEPTILTTIHDQERNFT